MLIEKDEYLVFPCPHCDEMVLVYKNDINCGIFRHSIYKENYKKVNPHLPKKLCEYLISNELIYGCSKPIRVFICNDKYEVEKCDYI
jgi:hypothetical protein